MVRKQKVIEFDECDFCEGNKSASIQCLECKRWCCWDCEKKRGVKYDHGVFSQGSSDGLYCRECDATCDDELHRAYRRIRELQTMYRRVQKDVMNESEQLEKITDALSDQKRGVVRNRR